MDDYEKGYNDAVQDVVNEIERAFGSSEELLYGDWKRIRSLLRND